MLKDAMFQLQQREAFSPRYRLSTIATVPIPHMDFHVLLNLDVHPTSRFGKTICCNLSTLIADHKNKWETVELMDGYYVVSKLPFMSKI